MNVPLVRKLAIGVVPALLAFAVAPSLIRIQRLQNEIEALNREVHTDHLMADEEGEPAGDRLSEGDVFGALIERLAGDRPGKFGDLTFGEPESLEDGRRVPFAVTGQASFPEVTVALDALGELWPVVVIDGFEMERSESRPLLEVRLAGHLRLHDDAQAIRSIGVGGPLLSQLTRDPFVESRPVVRRWVPPSRARASSPPFQGTVVIDGEKFAFFGGRAYRLGEQVGEARLGRLEGGRPVLVPLGD